MVHNNKILTVSYGTFSCTLEGFEDSFDTMKAIAEYFRDLAADDRYFGAEPPQPDAEMLARIAQREVARRVEAHHDGTGIVLRAHDGETPAALAAGAVVAKGTDEVIPEAEEAVAAPSEDIAGRIAQVDAAEGVAEIETAQDEPEPIEALTDDADAAIADDTPEAETAAADEDHEDLETPEPVADVADLAGADVEEIEDTVTLSDEAPAEALEEDTAEADPVAVDDTAEAAEAETEEEAVAPEPMVADATDEPAEETGTEAAPATMGEYEVEPERPASHYDLSEMEQDAPTADEPDESDIVPAADSIAAKLQRIRAVVSRNEAEAADTGYSEDEHAEDYVSEAVEDIAASLNADDTDEDETDVIELGSVAQAVADADEPMTLEAEDEGLFEDIDDEDDDDTDALPNLLGEEDEDLDEDLDEDDTPLARVVKVKRADLEAAIAQGAIEEVDEEESADSSLSPEDEADLMRELAEIQDDGDHALHELTDDLRDEPEISEMEMAEAEPEPSAIETDDIGDDEDEEEVAHRPGKSALPPVDDDDDADLARLMAEVGSKMDEPETSQRREAYSHLRAAVAATKAEASVSGDAGDDDDGDVYRDDLANVVRPRRPDAGQGADRARRPDDARPAPLKLVAEQRVDTDADAGARGPVRPRRVSAADMEAEAAAAPSEAEGGFARFATEVGATELPDLLEAAAAYMAFVEGRDQFSRPQLMTKVRQVEAGDFNREDGLRSFGQLLRDGKIQKISGGRFAASDQIGFKPQKRAAG